MAILKKLSTGLAIMAMASTALTPIAAADNNDRKRVRGDKAQKSEQGRRYNKPIGQPERVRRTGPGGVKAYGGERSERRDRGERRADRGQRGDRGNQGDRGQRNNVRSDRGNRGNGGQLAGGRQGDNRSNRNDRRNYKGDRRNYKGDRNHYNGKRDRYRGHRSDRGYNRAYNRGYNKGYNTSHRTHRNYGHKRSAPRYSYRAPRYSYYRPHRVFRHYSRPVYYHSYRPVEYYTPRYTIGGYYGYHSDTIILSNYRYYDLYDPPHGYHWVRDYDSGDAILASIATGAVIGLIIGVLSD